MPGQQITYRCVAGTPGVAYGTDIYTGDSSICTAAVHAGKTTAAGGTDFIIEQAAGQAMLHRQHPQRRHVAQLGRVRQVVPVRRRAVAGFIDGP